MRKVFGFAAVATSLIAACLVLNALGQAPPQPAKLYVYSGVLRSIDKQARTIMVEGSAISQKFVVPTDAVIIVKDKPKGELGDLMVGDRIQIKYTEDDGANVAHEISLLGIKNP